MGVRWPREEWKPNMAELEASVVFDKRKRPNKEQFLYRQLIFNVSNIIRWMFFHYSRKGNSGNKDEFFSKYCTMNCESGFSNFGNSFSKIAGNIYVNRRQK